MGDSGFLSQRISFRVVYIRLLESMGAPLSLLEMERDVLRSLRERFVCSLKREDGVLC